MGLIKAIGSAFSSTMADQWKEFFYCDALSNEVLVKKGQKRVSGRSSNTKGDDNIISNGSVIAVNEGQCMIIVEQGKVVDVCAEPGEFVYDTSTEPSLFSGSLGTGIIETFKTVGKRFTFGGDTAKDQRVYYFNTKEILNNKFGTQNPIMFEVVNKRMGMSRTVQVRCNGIYSYVISNPLIFYSKVCGNVVDEYTRERLDAQLKTEFISALQPALGMLSELELRPAQLPAKATELKNAMNDALKVDWEESRGISVGKIALNPITLTPEDMTKINEMEDAATMGQNPFMIAGRMTTATADAMQAAAGNSAGAMNGFIGMGMVNGMGGMGNGGGFGAAQNFYNMGVEQQAQQQAAASWKCSCGATAQGKFCANCGGAKPEASGADKWQCKCGTTTDGKFCPNCGEPKPTDDGSWKCTCGSVNNGKFCANCGAKKPTTATYKCDKCGWVPSDPQNPPKFCPECGDIIDDKDRQ